MQGLIGTFFVLYSNVCSYPSSIYETIKFMARLFLTFSLLCTLFTVFSQKNVLVTQTGCAGRVAYSVDDYPLSLKTGKLPMPDVKPEYEYGRSALLSYFTKYPLPEYQSNVPNFQVNIAFVVSCKGEVGDYTLLSKHEGDAKDIANLLLSMARNMPPHWMPAKVKGMFTDSWQVLMIKVENGQVVSVQGK